MVRKLVSYLIPLTRYIKSEYNGMLELTTIDGKKLLNTKNTNYSYGSLQKVLRFSLKQTDLSMTKNVLVLGMGGGSVLKTLRNDFGYSGNIVAVDIDSVIIDIAKQEFQIAEDNNTKIIHSDAFHFVMNTEDTFDLIIIDLFIDNKVPDKFLLLDFWREVINRINPNGSVIFNTLCIPFTDTRPIKDKLAKRGLRWKLFRYVEKTNKVLIASYG